MKSAEARLATDEMCWGRFRRQSCGWSLSARMAPWLALMIALLWAGRLTAQQQTSSPQPPTIDAGNVPFNHMDPDSGPGIDTILRQKRLRQMKEVQHKTVVSDTERLLKLVTALNTEITQTKPAVLSNEQLREVAEIEKLAHKVRDMMRFSIQ